MHLATPCKTLTAKAIFDGRVEDASFDLSNFSYGTTERACYYKDGYYKDGPVTPSHAEM